MDQNDTEIRLPGEDGTFQNSFIVHNLYIFGEKGEEIEVVF